MHSVLYNIELNSKKLSFREVRYRYRKKCAEVLYKVGIIVTKEFYRIVK